MQLILVKYFKYKPVRTFNEMRLCFFLSLFRILKNHSLGGRDNNNIKYFDILTGWDLNSTS